MSYVQAQLGIRATYVDTTKQLHDASETLRAPYLTEIYRAGRDFGSLSWWVTSVSYRNGIYSKTFHQACVLKLALDTVATWKAQEPLVLVAPTTVRKALKRNLRKDPAVKIKVKEPFQLICWRYQANVINMLIHRVWFAAKESHRVFMAKRFLPDIPQIVGPMTVLLAWATPGNIHLGPEFHSSFFGPLVERISNNGSSVAIAPIIVRRLGYKGALKTITNSDQIILLPHRYISYWDVIRAASATMIRPTLPLFASSFCGMDIRPFVDEDLKAHWITNAAANALLIPPLVRRWESLGFQITRFIYIYENQPMERALCWQAHKSFSKSTLIGYQHARVPHNLLNFHLAPEGETDAPLPDRIVTVGGLTARVMCENGYQPERIRVGGALQWQSLLKERPETPDSSISLKQPMVLVASGDSIEETVELAYMAANLFRLDHKIQIVLKCHPEMPFKNVKGLIGGEMPGNVQVSDKPILDLLSKASAVVYSGSTVAVQALALDVPVIHLSPRFGIDMDPLETVPDLRLEATGLEELRVKVQWLLKNREEYIAQHNQEWARMVEDMYGPVTEDTIHAFVD